MAKLNINNMLKKYALTQKDLAECTGINKNTISKYCNDTFENINKTHIDLLCKFFDCTPNDLFEIDNTVDVKSPDMILYDEQTDEFELYNKPLKNYKQILTRQNRKKIDCEYFDDFVADSGFKVNEDKHNYSCNIKLPSLEQENELVNSLLEKQVAKEVQKQFDEKYNKYLLDYVQNYIYKYLNSKFFDYEINNQNKDCYKEDIQKYKNFKIKKSSGTNTLNQDNNSSLFEDWQEILSYSSGIENLNIDEEIEPCIAKKKKCIKKD